MKKVIILFVFLIAIGVNRGACQSMVTEIKWTVASGVYQGLLVLYPNNLGDFVVKFYDYNVGLVWCHQNAVLTNQYDAYGNCMSYITCSNPKTQPYVPYAADNFLVYPNGSMYTQDYAGNWSTLITAVVVPQSYWHDKFLEYGLK